MQKTAFITGISGQDGAYLSQFLIKKGYQVVGGDRRTASGSLWRLKELDVDKSVDIIDFELSEMTNISRVMQKYNFDEVYNLAAQSFVGSSFEVPLMTSDITGLGVTRILESLRHYNPEARFYQASTSEMFGNISEVPQNEQTKFYPRSPYGISKLYAHWMTINYREAYDMYTCSGILFNHESPLRGEEFVTRKITMAVARIFHGDRIPVRLGNLSSKRDWGFAGDYVKAMWLMLQNDEPKDYVISSGHSYSVRDFAKRAFACIGIDLEWRGKAKEEIGVCKETGDILVVVDSKFYRPAEVDNLQGDFSKASKELGWKPELDFDKLVKLMVERDIERQVR